RKSNPTSARKSPAGTVSTSVVRKGRSCANAEGERKERAARARTVLRIVVILSKTKALAKRIIQIRKCGNNGRFSPKYQLPKRSLLKSRLFGRRKFLVRPSALGPYRQNSSLCPAGHDLFQLWRFCPFRKHDFESICLPKGILGFPYRLQLRQAYSSRLLRGFQ